MELSQVSQQAFQQQISNWQMTLHRQSKKLKQLKKLSKNKFQINSIQITLIQIESQLIQYKKIKGKKYQDSINLIEDYTALSKRFMNIMQKIGESVQQDRFKDTVNEIQIQKTKENQNPNKSKHFMVDTFTHKVSKEPSRKKAHSTITTKKQLSDLLKKEGKTYGMVKQKNSLKIGKFSSNLHRLQIEQQEDLSDIRYQLKQIKSMMVQIQNQIKFHSHQQMERQISKIMHNNKKISNDIKEVKEDNQFILARLQNIKEQINHEKAIQAEMIKQFQLGKDSRAIISELSKSKNTAQEQLYKDLEFQIGQRQEFDQELFNFADLLLNNLF